MFWCIFYQYYHSSWYQKQLHEQQKEIMYSTCGTKRCRCSSAPDTLLYCIFIFPTSAIPQIKWALCKKKNPKQQTTNKNPKQTNKKTEVKFCFLLLRKFHRPFVGNLSPQTLSRVWELWQPEYSFQKHNHQTIITKWWVSRDLIETKVHPWCPKALKAIQIVSSSLKKLLCNLRHQILTPFYTLA